MAGSCQGTTGKHAPGTYIQVACDMGRPDAYVVRNVPSSFGNRSMSEVALVVSDCLALTKKSLATP